LQISAADGSQSLSPQADMISSAPSIQPLIAAPLTGELSAAKALSSGPCRIAA
jgi:hypothetical protein